MPLTVEGGRRGTSQQHNVGVVRNDVKRRNASDDNKIDAIPPENYDQVNRAHTIFLYSSNKHIQTLSLFLIHTHTHYTHSHIYCPFLTHIQKHKQTHTQSFFILQTNTYKLSLFLIHTHLTHIHKHILSLPRTHTKTQTDAQKHMCIFEHFKW